MATYNHEKKYWIQLRRDFFKRHDIRILESQTNGKEYALFYLKLMLESIDHNGELRFSDTLPYSEEMLATITDTNVDIVKGACKVLYQLGMIDILDDGTLFLNQVSKLIGSTTVSAEKKQEQIQKRLEGNKGGNNSTKDKDINKDINILKENIRENPDFISNIPTLKEIEEFITLKNFHVDAERFKNHYDSVGWMSGNTPITNWQAILGSWEREDMRKNNKGYEQRKYNKEELDSVITDINTLTEEDL